MFIDDYILPSSLPHSIHRDVLPGTNIILTASVNSASREALARTCNDWQMN